MNYRLPRYKHSRVSNAYPLCNHLCWIPHTAAIMWSSLVSLPHVSPNDYTFKAWCCTSIGKPFKALALHNLGASPMSTVFIDDHHVCVSVWLLTTTLVWTSNGRVVQVSGYIHTVKAIIYIIDGEYRDISERSSIIWCIHHWIIPNCGSVRE